jgi:hypothetical protein
MRRDDLRRSRRVLPVSVENATGTSIGIADADPGTCAGAR